MKWKNRVIHAGVSVSYTHLDVYKRQLEPKEHKVLFVHLAYGLME